MVPTLYLDRAHIPFEGARLKGEGFPATVSINIKISTDTFLLLEIASRNVGYILSSYSETV